MKHDPEGSSLTADDVPNTPESNTPELEYAAGEPAAQGPMDVGEARPAQTNSYSPLENLPESISVAQSAERSNRQFQGGGY
jgi:hypothetical protein